MSNSCPRCGHIAAANGHATYGETQDCIEAFAFAQQLAKWSAEWNETSGSEDGVNVQANRCLIVDCSQHHRHHRQ